MSKEEGTHVLLPPRPIENDPKAWKVYWGAQVQPWRTELEIDHQRQTELAQCRAETSPRHPLRRAILIVAEKPLDFTLDTTSCMRQESY